MYQKLYLALFLMPGFLAFGQMPQRPAITGIARITYLASSFEMVEAYYGGFLGFDKAFMYPSALGMIAVYKVNDHQFLEFLVDKDAPAKNRIISVSFQTTDVEAMRLYLESKGLNVPPQPSDDGAGNKTILVHDGSGVPIEFVSFAADGLHLRSEGRHVSKNRISKRIHHVGLYAESIVDSPEFYTKILGFKPMFRYPESLDEPVFMTYYHMPESTGAIEHYPSDDMNFTHPGFLVEDMQQTLDELGKRNPAWLTGKPVIGKTGKWLLNLKSPDGTKVEFTEAYTIR